jgi:hypothetical protein
MPILPPVFRVLVIGPQSVMLQFLTKWPLEPQAVTSKEGGLLEMALFVDPRQRDELVAMGVRIEEQFDVRARDQQILRQVGRGNRFAQGRIPPGSAVKVK